MAITSLDILNLSHSLKDICEVNCNTPECLSQALKILMQYNLIQANLEFGRQFGPLCPPNCCRGGAAISAPDSRDANPIPVSGSHALPDPVRRTSVPGHAAPAPDSAVCPSPEPSPGAASAPPVPSPSPPIRLDIADPFLADYEK